MGEEEGVYGKEDVIALLRIVPADEGEEVTLEEGEAIGGVVEAGQVLGGVDVLRRVEELAGAGVVGTRAAGDPVRAGQPDPCDGVADFADRHLTPCETNCAAPSRGRSGR